MSRSSKPVVALRKPPTPDSIEAFVRGESAAPQAPQNVTALPTAPAAPVAQPAPAAAEQPGLIARQDGRTRRRMTVYLPPDLAQALKVQSAVTGKEMSDLIADALRAHLER